MSGLSGKVAIVTGASRGIGRAIALRLAGEGAKVIINYAHNEQAAAMVRQEIVGGNGAAHCVQADITDTSQIPRLFDETESHFSAADILVNNAGIAAMGSIARVDEEGYDRAFSITRGVYFLLREAISRIKDNGRVVNMSTGLTRGWAENAAAYAGSKAAIEVFTRSLSKQLGERGITVNAVLPGVTETDMTAGFPAQVLEGAIARSSLGRLGQPEDIADVVCFLASHDARWITGQLIVANGGSSV